MYAHDRVVQARRSQEGRTMTKIVYQWVKVSDLQTGWHIHIDGTYERVPPDYGIESIQQVGEDVIEIRASRGIGYEFPPIVLHRKPTDEVSVFGVEEDGS